MCAIIQDNITLGTFSITRLLTFENGTSDVGLLELLHVDSQTFLFKFFVMLKPRRVMGKNIYISVCV